MDGQHSSQLVPSSLFLLITQLILNYTMTSQVLILGKVHYAEASLQSLQQTLEFVQCTSSSRQEFFEHCKAGGKYSQVKAVYTNGTGGLGAFDRELVDNLPETVKVVAHHGAGYDVSGVLWGTVFFLEQFALT